MVSPGMTPIFLNFSVTNAVSTKVIENPSHIKVVLDETQNSLFDCTMEDNLLLLMTITSLSVLSWIIGFWHLSFLGIFVFKFLLLSAPVYINFRYRRAS